MEKVARPRTVLERCFMMLVVMAMVLSLFASAAPPVNASTLPSNTQTQVNPPADTPEMADAVYYKYPFQNPLLSAEDRVNNLISLMTLDEKIALLHQFSGAIIRLGVPQFRTGTEGLHGLSWLGPATVFPQGTGLSNTWDQTLINQIGKVVGDEARAYNSVDARFNGIDIWAPVIDLARDPRAGRLSENMGEDPYLSGTMSTNYAFGMKGTDLFYFETIPTLKHFTAYGQEANRSGYSANASPRVLQEYYLKAFEYGINAGAVNSMMTAYNNVNGKPTMTMPEMRTDIFGKSVPGGIQTGNFFVVTDAGSPGNLSGSNAYYPSSTLGQAAAMADSIKSGVSAFTPGDTDTPTTRRWIYEAIARGMLTEKDIETDIHGMLLVRCHAGDLDADPINPYKQLNKQNALTTAADNAVAAQAAREQVVLLKNDGSILPLSKSLANVALIGPLADENSTDFYAGTYPYVTFIKDKVQAKLTGGAAALSFTRGLNTIALQVTNGTGTPAGKFIVVGTTADAALTGTGTSSADPNAQFYLYDYGYDNMLLRSVTYNSYLAARGSGNTIVANASAPGFISNNRASQQWATDQNFGFVTQNGTLVYPIVGLSFVKGTGIPNPTGNPNMFVSTTTPYNVQSNGSGSSSNRQFTVVTVADGTADAVTKATGANVAIVAVGDQPSLTSRETNDRSTTGDNINLPPYQEALINAVAAVNPNTVVVVVGSYPFDLTRIQANPNVKGIVYTSHAGQELGTGVADVLFGDYAPAGRLNQTWYPGLGTTPNFTLPTISDYDIIKGQRTYQYYPGAVLYPFGYGLTYTTFDYSNFNLTPSTALNTSSDSITATLTVTNTGTVASDEVVQLYTKFKDAASSKIQHPLKSLSGFTRIHLNAGESKPVSFTVKVSDLAIWDVSRSMFYVEPGAYTFMVGRSSADADVKLTGDIAITGDPIPARNLSITTPAYNFDDYSFTDLTSTGLQADVIEASAMEDNTYDIQARKSTGGGWVEYKNVDLSAVPTGIAMRASNANATASNIEVWQTGPNAAAGGVLLGTVSVPVTGHIQTFVNVGASLTGLVGTTGNLYLVFTTGIVSVKWLKLGTLSSAVSSDVVVASNTYNSSAATSLSRLHIKVAPGIYQKSGSLLMEAMINGSGIATSAVTWTVTDEAGSPTPLATITTSGVLAATGTGDGKVRAVATYTTADGTISAYQTVELKNQSDPAGTNPEAVIIRSGFDSRPKDISWGPNQFTNFGAIYQKNGTLLLSAVTYPFVSGTNPARPVTFTLADKDGNPTSLATLGTPAADYVEGQTSGANNRAYNVSLQATGVGDGEVYVTATTANGLSYTSKIVIQNQGVRSPINQRYEAELFDASGNTTVDVAANLRADNVSGDDVGLQLNRIRNNDFATYKDFDFGTGATLDMTFKYVKVSSEPATIKVMVDDPITGTQVGTLNLIGDYNITTSDYAHVVYHWKEATIRLNNVPAGVHNMYLVFTVSPNVPNTDISSTYGAVAGWLDLGINWFQIGKGAQTITFPVISDKTYMNAPFTLNATSNSGLPVSYSATGTCTVAGNTVTITGAGSCTITASQPGDTVYNPALNVSRTFNIAKANLNWLPILFK